MKFPDSNSYPPYYHNYIHSVNEDEIISLLGQQIEQIKSTFLKNEERANYKYAEGKWTVRELLVHMIDVERVFSYRILCISRGETQALPGFNHDAYINDHDFDHIEIKSLIAEFKNLRLSNIEMISNLKDSQLDSNGTASGNKISTLAMIYILAGHVKHHLHILKTKYSVS